MHRSHPFRYATGVAIALACVVAACGTDAPAQDDVTLPAAPAAERLAGTPDGGLRSWVRDIRTGTTDLVERFREDRKSAEKTAVDLYVNRQEWLERYWGTYGLLTQSVAPSLGQAVMDAEARFHELLTILTEPEATESRVEEAVRALDAQLEQVLSESEAANVPLVPPADTAISENQQ